MIPRGSLSCRSKAEGAQALWSSRGQGPHNPWPHAPRTHRGVLEVVEAVVCEDEPAPLPCLHPTPCNGRGGRGPGSAVGQGWGGRGGMRNRAGKVGLSGSSAKTAHGKTDEQGEAVWAPGIGPPPAPGPHCLSRQPKPPPCGSRQGCPLPRPAVGARPAVYLPPGADSEKAGGTRCGREGRMGGPQEPQRQK
jgi:hypothetical protein